MVTAKNTGDERTQDASAAVERVDVLAERHRSTPSDAVLLAEAADDVIDEIVAEAAEQLNTPIALVSILLRNIQYFRAHTGLPEDLACVRATDRDASFCQFVVRDQAPVAIEDASTQVALPQQLVFSHGVRAYLGVPVHVAGEVVGSLCVLDTKPRRFSAEDIERLKTLCRRVEQRFEDLRQPAVIRERLASASMPVFSELRNQLAPIEAELDDLRVSVAEFAPLVRLSTLEGPGAAAASSALKTLQARMGSLGVGVDRLQASFEALAENLDALQQMTTSFDDGPALPQALREAARLAHHLTKLVGGVVLPEVPRDASVAGPRGQVIELLSSTLAAVAEVLLSVRDPGVGIEVIYAGQDPGRARLVFACPAVAGHERFEAANSAVGALCAQYHWVRSGLDASTGALLLDLELIRRDARLNVDES